MFKKMIISALVTLSSVAAFAGPFQSVGLNLMGSWNNQYEKFQGFDIQYFTDASGTDNVLAYWFTYDVDGKKNFFLAQGPITGATSTVPMYATSNGAFRSTTTGDVHQVGAISIASFDCNNAAVSFRVDDKTYANISPAGQISLTRLTPALQVNGQVLCQAQTTPPVSQPPSIDYAYWGDRLGTLCARVQSLQSSTTTDDASGLIKNINDMRGRACVRTVEGMTLAQLQDAVGTVCSLAQHTQSDYQLTSSEQIRLSQVSDYACGN